MKTGTRMIPAPVVRNWARRWPCDGFPGTALQYTVDGRGDLLDYAWVTVEDGEPVAVEEPEGVDGTALGAMIDDAQDDKIATIDPGHLEVA